MYHMRDSQGIDDLHEMIKGGGSESTHSQNEKPINNAEAEHSKVFE